MLFVTTGSCIISLYSPNVRISQRRYNMKKHTLTDSQWERIKDMLPANGQRGNQWKDHRMVINGILWILKNGAPWRSLPPRYGHWKTVFKRFRLWTRQGLWDRILERLQSDFQSKGKIDWRMFSIDGSNIRAHKSAAGAKKKRIVLRSHGIMP